MIIQIGTDADESRILWKYKESDEWKRADIDELIRAYENKHEAEVVRCKNCKHRHEDECPMHFVEQIDIDEGDGYYDTDYIFHDYTQDDGYCHYGERGEP